MITAKFLFYLGVRPTIWKMLLRMAVSLRSNLCLNQIFSCNCFLNIFVGLCTEIIKCKHWKWLLYKNTNLQQEKKKHLARCWNFNHLPDPENMGEHFKKTPIDHSSGKGAQRETTFYLSNKNHI